MMLLSIERYLIKLSKNENGVKGKGIMKKTLLMIILPIIVVALGCIGFISEGYGFYEALLESMSFLKTNFDSMPANVLIEIARWLGIIFFFSLIYSMVAALWKSGKEFVKSRMEDAVAIHGDDGNAQLLAESLGSKGILSDGTFSFGAPRQVIMFKDDKDSLNFYHLNAEKLKDKEVHILLNQGAHAGIERDNLFVLNMDEAVATEYWKNNPAISREKIVIIGSGKRAEALLYWGLLTNVFDVEKNCDYVMIGNHEKYRKLYPDVERRMKEYGGDTVTFIDEPWFNSLDEVIDADRVILAGDTDENIEIAKELHEGGYKINLHAYMASESMKKFFEEESVKCFGYLTKENIQGVLLRDDLHTNGKLCDAAYQVSVAKGEQMTLEDVQEYIKTEEFKNNWRRLSSFTKESNYASAIHDVQKKRLLEEAFSKCGETSDGNNPSYEDLSAETWTRLQEIEHIRWCRYHFLNNWKQSDKLLVVNGKEKTKDEERRLHFDLRPYEALTEGEKKKDGDAYKTIFLRG